MSPTQRRAPQAGDYDPTSSNPAERLAHWVLQRRHQLDVTQVDVWMTNGGPSNTTLTKIENGLMETLTRKTAKQLDKGLKWEDGSARGIFERGDAPRPLVNSPHATRDTTAELRRFIEEAEGVDQATKDRLLGVLREDAPAPSSADDRREVWGA